MKKDLKNKLAYGAMLLAMVVFSVGCSKDTVGQKEKEKEEDLTKNYPEYRLYTVGDSALVVRSHLSSVFTYDGNGGPPVGTHLVCGVEVHLRDLEWASEMVEYTFGDRTIVTTPLTSTRIVGMDVITNADYDDAHPAGSSVSDIMEIGDIKENNRQSPMDLTDYFATYPGLDVKARTGGTFVFLLDAKSMPLEENEIIRTDLAYLEPGDYMSTVDFTLVLTLADGSVVEITDLIPDQKI